MKKLVTTKVIDIDNQGYGIASVGERKIRILGGIPGETVVVELLRKKKARILKVLESEYRRAPICPHYLSCGGCLWQTIPYSKQLELKQYIVERLFKGISNDIEIRSIIPSERIYGYREKMEFIIFGTKHGLSIGMREVGKFDRAIDIYSCWLQTHRANKVLENIRYILSIKDFVPYNILTHEGFLRYLVIRSSFTNKDTVAILVTTSSGKIDSSIYEESNADGLVWAINDSLTDIAYGSIKKSWGRTDLHERVFGLDFKICPFCFYQSNPVQARTLFKLVKSFGGLGDMALDLYSGVGTISLIVADNFDYVLGIEQFEDSVMAAKNNAMLNGISNVEFIQGKVEVALSGVRSKISTIFLDPPRPGITKKVVKEILRLAPKTLVYVSCNPSSQARDIELFVENGYRLEVIQPIDMLPNTPHIENLALLVKTY